MAPRWTAAEDATLRRSYRAGSPLEAIGAELGRTSDAIDARRRCLALPARTSEQRPWPTSEDTFLRAATAARIPAAEIGRRLARSHSAVRQRRRELRLSQPAPRQYLPAEREQIVLALGAGRSLETLGESLGRSEAALRLQARKLGLIGGSPRHRWSPEEDRKLRQGYSAGLAATRIRMELLPERTAGAIVARARLLGLATYARRWTPAEEGQLAALASAGFPLDAIASRLHRSREAILCRCRSRGLPAPSSSMLNARKRWTSTDDAVLRESVADTLSLARRLRRPESAVRRRRQQLGLDRVERTAHHALPAGKEPTPGLVRLVARELPLGPGHALAAARRLELPLADLRALSRAAQSGHANGVIRPVRGSRAR